MKTLKEYVIITIGISILALGLSLFLIPADLAVGGITGFAMVLTQIIPTLSIGAVMLVANAILFVLGILIIGKQFGAKTFYASFTLSGMILLFEKFVQLSGPLVDDTFLNLFFGILVSGIGMAIVFYQNASTGGTDIIAKIINKFFGFEIGKSLMMVDLIVVTLAMKYYGLEAGLYALLGVIMNAYLIDNIIEGLNIKINVRVISTKPEELQTFILEKLERGATLYEAKGAFTKKEQYIISTVLSKREFIKIKAYIKETDPYAFVTAASVREVIGEGFKTV